MFWGWEGRAEGDEGLRQTSMAPVGPNGNVKSRLLRITQAVEIHPSIFFCFSVSRPRLVISHHDGRCLPNTHTSYFEALDLSSPSLECSDQAAFTNAPALLSADMMYFGGGATGQKTAVGERQLPRCPKL